MVVFAMFVVISLFCFFFHSVREAEMKAAQNALATSKPVPFVLSERCLEIQSLLQVFL